MTRTSISVGSPRVQAWCEWLLIVLIFALHAATTPPDVNEAHYLGKAKHYWDVSWCAGDPFLESADAHWFFFWTFGWLTKWLSLAAVAWLGRIVTWSLLAWSLRRLCVAVVPGKWRSVLVAALLATLIRWGHVGGEWLLGGVEAKGFAYVLLLLELEAVARGRWQTAMLCGGAATAWHVLVGGWGLVALAWAWWTTPVVDRPTVRTLVPAGLLAVAFTLPGVVPGLLLTWGQDPEVVREANRIYVFERLSHHLVFHRLSHIYIFRHAVLMIAFGCGWRWLRRRESNGDWMLGAWPRFIVGGMVIAIAGAVLDQSLLYFRPLAAAILRYYWFRLSDVLTPLGVALVATAVQQWWSRIDCRRGRWILATLAGVAGADLAWVVMEHRMDPRPESMIQAFRGAELSRDERLGRWQQWLRMCEWIKENTAPTDLFLTPRFQQSFKWDAERPEVVSGKDVPQDAVGVVAWRKRMDDIFPYTIRFADLVGHGETRLRELSKKYNFRYIVIDRAISTGTLSFPRVYPVEAGVHSAYEVYRVDGL